ncbi:nucleotide exchange factor SIL1 [Electrophorus electricus]|uniref:Nucleotide exchange factor SIL1 n=1 Tax=Electrophorus electricus TaxID=8005 RepID=A0A4W4FF79_ELEEL|nr:nucleotide exchange factor SIL1 [Electrophorus electricus]
MASKLVLPWICRSDFSLLMRFVSSGIISNTMQINNSKVRLKMALIVWYLSLQLVGTHTEKFRTALTIKEGLDDLNIEEDAESDTEDMEVFYPTSKWQTLKPGQAVPAGSHVRLNLQTGQREAKLGEEEGLKYWTDGKRQGMVNQNAASFTPQELKEALKKFKKEADDFSKKDSEQDKESVRAQFRSMNELKKDMEALDLLVETDVQIMRKLLSKIGSINSTVDERVTALLDLEYLVHQVDNAQNLVTMGGLQLVTDALNSTDVRLQESAAFVLGSAVSGNPTVQVEAFEGGALQKLLTLLATPRLISVKKKVLFALACLLRHFPFAQSHFVKHGGVQVLGELFQAQDAETLRVRIVTLLYDMITEKELISQHGTDAPPGSTNQERLRQYAEVSFLPMLAEQGWCGLVPELLASPDHDWREKALHTLLAMMPHCLTQYQQNPKLITSLSVLQKQYQELVLTEETQGEEEGYFNEVLALVDSLVVKMH